MTHGGWKAPSNIDTTEISVIKTEAPDDLSSKSSSKRLPAVLDGMDKAEALAYVSRLFDAAQAGAAVWGDKLLIQRFIRQCSRTGSKATQEGYRFEIREFTRWRDRHHPHLHLREMNPAFCQDWVDELRREVEAERMKPRTFNRRIAAISSLFRWAAEPSRSAVTGVPRNPMPPRALLHAEKTTRPLTTEQFGLLMAAITRAAHLDPNAQRDYVLIKGAYLLGCRVSEIAAIRWRDIEALDDGGRFTSSARDQSDGLFAYCQQRLASLKDLAVAKLTAMYFLAPQRFWGCIPLSVLIPVPGMRSLERLKLRRTTSSASAVRFSRNRPDHGSIASPTAESQAG